MEKSLMLLNILTENEMKTLSTEIVYKLEVFIQNLVFEKDECERRVRQLTEEIEKNAKDLVAGRKMMVKKAEISRNLLVKYTCIKASGLDYGSGMAYNFFYGYINIVVPKISPQDNSLQEKMLDYEAKHSRLGKTVKFASYKLFVLIPHSLYCPDTLATELSPSIEESSSLEEKILRRAGVRDRSYKNSVYKIRKGNKFFYVVAEYATPLRTFREVMEHHNEHSDCYRKYGNEIIWNFYVTLQKLIDHNEECRNFCHLIVYQDKDESGNLRDVGTMLLEKITKMSSKNWRSASV